MAIDAQAHANGIAADWHARQTWLQARAAERKQARPTIPAPASRASDALHQALLEVKCDDWLPALTGVEIPRSRMVRCPFHGGGQERTPSCRFYDTSFYCFGCGRGGDIYCFAGELWGIPTRSRTFPELRERLVDQLLGVTA